MCVLIFWAIIFPFSDNAYGFHIYSTAAVLLNDKLYLAFVFYKFILHEYF